MKNIITTAVIVSSLAVPALATQGATSSGTMGSAGPLRTNNSQNSDDLRLGFSVQQELQRKVIKYNPNRQTIYTQSGEVTLSGSVNSRAEADEMERSVRRVRGVSRVNNNLVVNLEVDDESSDSLNTDSE